MQLFPAFLIFTHRIGGGLPPGRVNWCFGTADLTGASLTSVPDKVLRNYTNLVTLILSNNEIIAIDENAFQGLTSLRNLSLSHNDFESWDSTAIPKHLKFLESLDMSGNDWIPSSEVLRMRSLSTIRGVSWGQCSDCELTRNVNQTQLDRLLTLEDLEWVPGYACRARIHTYSAQVKRFAKEGFYPSCLVEGSECFAAEVKVRADSPCRDVNTKVLTLEYVFGPVALVLNLVVVVTTACSRRLRRNIAMVLVSNLAFGDLLNGIHAIAVAVVHHIYDYAGTRKFADTKCDYIGPLWMLGQAISVSCSLVLTYERYRSVVNSVKVKVKSKMKMKTARISIFVCWVWSFAAAFLPLAGIGMYSIGTFCIPIYPVRSIPHQFWYSVVVTLIAATMYIVTFPLYIRLYLYVKRSSNRIGSKTDVALAKRIFVLVMSNMFFFLLPIMISLAWSVLSRHQVMSRVVAEVLTSSFCLICLTVNSCLNPVLYALRNRTFIKELRRMLYHMVGWYCGWCSDNGRGSNERTSRSNSASRGSTHQLQKYAL
ncbi:predicted protein [Nematostella vectensis]|uniref:G-protein coupled receptors family 1 profile domain-containing protein n=1 Tax=Nematostella vectensis TaxID=45351 RepID=A7SJN7_NEMVE|nr:predicted protein [Nematostella vectensis]|eukprot:XP_001628140.1 predicted protein [Nematostella vectensis]